MATKKALTVQEQSWLARASYFASKADQSIRGRLGDFMDSDLGEGHPGWHTAAACVYLDEVRRFIGTSIDTNDLEEVDE